MPVSSTAGEDPPLKQLAMAYGIRKRGWDQLSEVSAAIQRELPDAAWEAMPEHLRGRRVVTRLVKDQAVGQVIGTMVMNIDGGEFASFKRGLPLDGRLRSSIEGMVEAVAFREGGASEFVDIVLENMRSHLSSSD
jgi:hypothetical protein